MRKAVSDEPKAADEPKEPDEEEEWPPDPDAEEARREGLQHATVGSGVGAFTRCFVGVDRLLAISRLHNMTLTQTGETERWALLWTACGTIRELLKAVDSLNRVRIKRHLTGDGLIAWREIRVVLDRWRSDPIYKRVRNSLAFHFDDQRKLFDTGLKVVSEGRGPLYLSEGYEGKVYRFPFAQLIMLGGLFPDHAKREEEFEHFRKGVRHAQARIGGLLYRVLVATLKAAAPGLSPLQQQRARLLRVLSKRIWALPWEGGEKLESEF